MSKKENQYLCSCFQVTKDDVKEHIRQGVTKFKELQEKTNIGTECSDCKTKAKAKFKKYKEKLST